MLRTPDKLQATLENVYSNPEDDNTAVSDFGRGTFTKKFTDREHFDYVRRTFFIQTTQTVHQTEQRFDWKLFDIVVNDSSDSVL